MKTFFWLVTIIGLLPLTAFAVLHILSCLSIRREIAKDAELADDDETVIIGLSSIQYGESMAPMVVNPRAWPAVVVVVGAATCLLGLYFLIPRQPIRVSEDGYERFEPLIRRVMSSNRGHSSLIVSARGGNEAFLLMHGESGLELSLSADSTKVGRIRDIKSYFSSRGHEPAHEYSTHDDHFDTDATHLEFQLDGRPTEVAELCIGLFKEVLEIHTSEPMEFRIEP